MEHAGITAEKLFRARFMLFALHFGDHISFFCDESMLAMEDGEVNAGKPFRHVSRVFYCW